MSSASPAPASIRFGLTDAGLVLMAVIWGVNYSVMKAGLQGMPPLAFSGLRILMAALTLAGIAAMLRDVRWPSVRDRWHLIALGVMGNGIYQLFFVFGLARTRAGVAALITAAGPAWIAIISRMLGRERISRQGWAGILLQLLGAAAVVGSTQGFGGDGQILLGAILIACGSITWGLFSVLLQPYTQRAHPLHLSTITMASGTVVLMAVAWPELRALDWRAVGVPQWGAITYAGVGSLVIAYLLFYRGVRVLGPTRTAMYGNLQPIIALSVAWATLGERPTSWQLIGTACIMGGLLVSRTAQSRERAASPASIDDAGRSVA